MANSKAKNFLLGNPLVLLGLACAIIAIFMPYALGFNKMVNPQNAYTFIFGYKGSSLGSYVYPSLSTALAGWILILVGLVSALIIVPVAFLTKNGLRIGKFTFGQVLGGFAALLLVVGGILFFFPAMQYNNYLGADQGTYTLGIGFLLSAIFAIFGGVFCCLPLFVTLKK